MVEVESDPKIEEKQLATVPEEKQVAIVPPPVPSVAVVVSSGPSNMIETLNANTNVV